jgi:RND family efflux transporter MFP subunit
MVARGAVLAVSLLIAIEAAAEERSEFECLLEPLTEVELGSPVKGILESIEVKRGETVEKGQVLATLQADAEQAAVDLAHAKLEFGRRKMERNRELFKDDYVSELKLDQSITEARLAEVELQQAETMLGQKTLKSPIEGLVVERALSVGEFVSENEIMRLARIDPLSVEVVVPVEYFGEIAEGMEAEVFPQDPVGGTYVAEVVTVDRVVDAASGTFGVELELPNPGNEVPAGLKCRVRFPMGGDGAAG